jgi:poly-beta-1,6-N-acetyl-D-glucosamine synthase
VLNSQIQQKMQSKYAPVTVLVPAYNEENTISETLDSLNRQSQKPENIIVIDDFSSDRTGEIAKAFGVTVIRPPHNTGSKAGAQSFALPIVTSRYTIAIDADTSLEDNAIEKMVKVMEENPNTVAMCSFVLPKKISSIWERGRFIEYMFAFTFYKQVQNWYGKPLISSGCFSIYRTTELKAVGGWSARTMAEDMDLTWTLYEKGKIVMFNPETFCFPIEPHTLQMMSNQLTRWSHGLFQNLKIHWKKIKKVPVLREIIIAAVADIFVGGAVAFVVGPATAIVFHNPWIFLYGLASDFLFIGIPVAWKGWKLKKFGQVITSLPGFYLLRWVNAIFLYKAAIMEYVLHKSLTKYEKGH